MKKLTFRQVLKAINNYVMFFLVVAFAVTCCMMLFVSTLRDSMALTLTAENTEVAAKLTFGNVILITFLFTVFDYVRRRLMVDRPVKRITEATEKIMQGDFDTRIEPLRSGSEGFNLIIDAINNMAAELGSVETLRSDFIANVSHEMKTPLAVIRNYGTMLQQPDLPPEKRMEYAEAVTQGARRLADMITNILKLNRLENQQIYPNIREYDLGEQLCQCLLQYEDIWEQADITIETELAEDVSVRADGELLELVWNNLFSNAFKFTGPGGTVSLGLTATETHAVVSVRDTGCGMTPEVGTHIFEKFYQGDTSHATGGNGLGLALVKRVVDILQGEIRVESEVGKGTAFTVMIRRN